MTTLLFLFSLLIVSLLAGATFLWFSAWLCLPAPVRWRRALGIVIVLGILHGAVLALFGFLAARKPEAAGALSLALIGVAALVTWLTLYNLLPATFLRSVLTSVPYVFTSALFGYALAIGFKLYLAEAFVIPTNSMAPTLVGHHRFGKCPKCGGEALVPSYRPEDDPLFFADVERRQKEEGELTICQRCFDIHRLKAWDPELLTCDRILCNKLLTPRRWDLVLFHYPPKPESIYVKRLVGFPGEEVVIKEGSVWIDGKKLEPPEELKGVRFTAKVAFGNFDSLDQALKEEMDPLPVQLSDKGFFMLGEFTLRASDSRDWGEVPRENIVGVATAIYWPPERWRIFR